MLSLAVYFSIALTGSLVLTPICRVVAGRLGYVAKPKDDRWHKRPTPLLGGIAIVAVVAGVGSTVTPRASIWPLLVCSGALAMAGLVDDLVSLKASTKLIAQIIVASALMFFGYRLHWIDSMLADAMLTLFWIVGITNAFNLLDNMDGLCAGVALIAGASLLAVSVSSGVRPLDLYLAALLGATAGFLVYNTNPASIFMGDTGSLFLGLNMAALTLTREPAQGHGDALLPIVAGPVLLLLIPIFDTTLVTALRLLSHRRPSEGGRDHSSHRLVAIGLSERRAVLVLWTLAALGGSISMLLETHPAWGLSVGVLFLLGMIIFAVYLARIHVYETGELIALKEGTFTPVVANFMYKRRVAEVLLDLCLIPIAYYTAYRLRFEGRLFAGNYQFFLTSLPVVIAAQLLALFMVGGYRGTWRYFGLMDAVVFAKGVALGTAGAVLAVLFMYRFQSYSRTVFVIDAALLMLLLAGTRGSFRLVGEFIHRRQSTGRRCVIYGTAGASLPTIRDAFGAMTHLKIVGFVDDNPLHERSTVSGYVVLGGFDALLALVRNNGTDCVVINMRRIESDSLSALELACQEHDVELLRLDIHLKPLSAVS
jgi:UDP-GlcNAc:undecaprenyl-phosphate GlcNAc-1-phosphate transferase